MPDLIRRLNPDGVAAFAAFVETARQEPVDVPWYLLSDPATSAPLEITIALDLPAFANRFELGRYLVDTLAPLDRRKISRDSGLWTWLALKMFDQIAPVDASGARKLLSPEAYVLPTKYDFRGYYRHLVRTPWMAVADHGKYAEVLLIPISAGRGNALAVRGEIIEQMASRQAILRNQRVIQAVHRMYWDAKKGKPRSGAGGSLDGSPRRLAMLLRQFDVTYDLDAAPSSRIVQLMPKDFERWKQ